MAKGLLAAGFNYGMVDAGEFNDWYDTEHLPERQRCKGFINCVRWQGVDDPRVSIATYDLESRDVLHSAPYQAIARDNLSPWSKRMTSKAQRLLRIEADQLIPGDEISLLTTQHLMIFACNVKPEHEAEVRRWYAEEHIPRLLKVPGVASARFFHAHAGTHNYIALYEIEKSETCASEAWKEAALTPWTKSMRPHLNDVLRVVLRRYQRRAS
ncbi:MAG TPA: hypothetical protein VK642_07270 [Burkholderiales bacterium]|nr:hypothetical protein [Burkholderiales bacterium]